MHTEPSSAPANKMATYRAKLRAQGLRPVQAWIPDTRSSQFQKEARRQSLLIAQDRTGSDHLDWLEIIADRDGWEV